MTERQLDVVMHYEGLYQSAIWLLALRFGALGVSVKLTNEPYFMFKMRDTLRDNLLIEALHGCLDSPL